MKTKLSYFLTFVFAFALPLVFAQAQTMQISGTVSDEDGIPLPGVNITIEGSNTGTSTDFDGKYSISASQGNTLLFTFVGMQDQYVEVGQDNTIDVTMQLGSQLGEVVITGALGIKRSADATTTAQKVVSAEDLNIGKNPNAVSALTGKVSGLRITNTSSGVDDNLNIQLRGMRSITGNNEALIVIDNVISDAATFETLPPEIIQDVNVIKGAQGAALYGSDGVNGVIIVTTKKGTGSENKLQIEYNGSVEFESTAFLPKRQNRYGQGWYNERDQYENGAWGPAFNGETTATGIPMYDYDGDGLISLDGIGWGSGTYETGDNPAAMVGPYERGRDYIKDFFETGTTLNNGVTISAGDREKYAMVNINRSSREFIIKGDERKKTAALFKGGIKTGKFTLDGSVNYIRTDMHQSPVMFDESDQQDPIYWHLLQAAPGVPVTAYKDYPDNAFGWNLYYQNPYWRMKHVRENRQTDLVNLVGSLAYEINDHINVSYRGNLRKRTSSSQSHRDAFDNSMYVGPGAAASSNISSAYFLDKKDWWDFYGDLMVNFDYDLSEDIHLGANVGHNYQEHRFSIMENGGNNLEVEGVYNMRNVTQPLPAGELDNDQFRKNSHSVFANIDLSYKNYLFLNATARNEWASTLVTSNNSYFYPSVGVSFVPTKAWDFGGEVLNYLKVAGSWTRVGNTSSVDWYDINQKAVLSSGYPFNGNNSFRDNMSPADQNLKPEFVSTTEFNLAAGFFNDRVVVDAAVYQADTKDMITQRTVSSTSGLSSQLVNIGKMRSKGAEVNLMVTPIQNKDWQWDVNVGYAYDESRVQKVTNEASEVSLITLGSIFGVFAQEGSLFPLIKTSMMARDDQGRIIINPDTGNPEVTSKLENAGIAVPKSIYNFGTKVRYKGFTLGAVADLRLGSKFIAYIKNGMAFNGSLLESGQLDREQGGFVMPNSVIPDGNGGYVPNTDVKTGGDNYNSVNDYYSSYYGNIGENYLTDGRAFKLREISLSYTFPTKWVSQLGLREVTLGGYARNPFTKFASQNQNFADPETSHFTDSSVDGYSQNALGIAYPGQYPSTKTYGFSLNIKY